MFGKSKLKVEIERLKSAVEELEEAQDKWRVRCLKSERRYDLLQQHFVESSFSYVLAKDMLSHADKERSKLIKKYENILSDCYIRDTKGRFKRYYKEDTLYKVTEKDLIRELKGFPIEVVQRMIECQVEQGNKADVTVFQNKNCCGIEDGGFEWDDTREGNKFWIAILASRYFDVFFKKYPKK